MADINFSNLAAQATEMINTSTTPAVETPTPVTQQPADASQTPQPQQTQVADPTQVAPVVGQPAEQSFEVDFGNGKKEVLTATQIRELQQSGLRQADYTRKTQELAQQREAIQQQAGLVEQARQLLNNPQQLLAIAQQQLQAQQPQVPIDPNAPVTVGQLQQLMQYQQQAAQQAQTAAQQYVEERLQVGKMAEDINGNITKLREAHPVLAALPEMEDVLRFRVFQAKPNTYEEAVSAFNAAAADITSNVEKVFAAKQQQAAVARQTMVAQAAEPPGGVAVQQQAPNYMIKQGREIDWKKLAAAGIAAIN